MVDALLDEVADVVDRADQRVDQRVLPAEGAHPHARQIELGLGVDVVDALASLRVGRVRAELLAQIGGHRARGPDLQIAQLPQLRRDALGIQVIGMRVGDQQMIGPVHGLLDLGEAARIQHQHGAVDLQADAGMGVLGQLHVGLLSDACTVRFRRCCTALRVLCSQPTDPLRPREGPVPRVHRTGPGAAPE